MTTKEKIDLKVKPVPFSTEGQNQILVGVRFLSSEKCVWQLLLHIEPHSILKHIQAILSQELQKYTDSLTLRYLKAKPYIWISSWAPEVPV